jgi:hypothetical protein
VSAIVAALAAMTVDEGAWIDQGTEDDCYSFEPEGQEDDFDGFAYFDGSWSYLRLDDLHGRSDVGGESANIRTAKIAIQQAHAIACLRSCAAAGRRDSSSRNPSGRDGK